MCKIRYARIEDLPSLVPLMEEFVVEYGYYGEADREVVIDSFVKYINSELITVIVAELDGVVVGVIAGLISPMLFKKMIQAQELFWFVTKKERSLKIGLALIDGWESVCIKKGVNYISMVAPKTLKEDKLGRIYEKLGYIKSETIYIKELK